MYIGPHTCMSGYVSAYHGVGKLCILLHTILCHAVDVWMKIATSGFAPLVQEWIGQALAEVNENKLSVRRFPVSLKGKQFDVKFIVTDDIMVDAISLSHDDATVLSRNI